MKLHTQHSVAVVAYEGISAFHLSVPCIVFGDDLEHLGVPRYDLQVCAETPGLIATLSGFSIDVRHDLSMLESAQTVIIPAWRNPNLRPSEPLLEALRKAHARGARMVGLCVGAFVLAEAGLLDGRAASTHWVWADDFACRFPQVRLDRDVLYVDDGDVLHLPEPQRPLIAACICCAATMAPRLPIALRAAWWWRRTAAVDRHSSLSNPCLNWATVIACLKRLCGRWKTCRKPSTWMKWPGAPP